MYIYTHIMYICNILYVCMCVMYVMTAWVGVYLHSIFGVCIYV